MSLTNLVGNRVSREEIYSLATPPGSRTHIPIPHSDLLHLMDQELYSQGIEIVADEHVLDQNGDRYFGMFALKSLDDLTHCFVGVINAHDKSIAAKIIIGERVFICSNKTYFGQIKLSNKHTMNISNRLPRLVEDGVSRALKIASVQQERVNKYRSTRITNDKAENLIIDLWRQNAIPSAAISKIVAQFENPKFPEVFLKDGHTLFTLQNATTEIIREKSFNNLMTNIGRSERLIEVLDKAALQLN